MLKRELELFLVALMFYTRIPVPAWIGHEQEKLESSRKYFPLIGWIIGGIGSASIYTFLFIFPLSVSILLGMALTVYWSGAFHEDGLNDSFDALGGAWNKDDVLRIMKDSRVGTFGVIALFMVLLLKFFALYELGRGSVFLVMAVWFNAQTMARSITTFFLQTHDYVRDPDSSKVKPLAVQRLSTGAMLYSVFWGALPLLLLVRTPYLLLAVVPTFLTQLYMARVFQKRIGGYTGDALGAVEQLCELVFLLSALALWNSIY
jgi:adenosylcobinamide-GDP ribazoletransferase